MKPTGAEEPRRGNTRKITGGRENVPPPTAGGGGTPETEGESASGSNANPPRAGGGGGASPITAVYTAALKAGGEGGASYASRKRRPLRSSMAPKSTGKVSRYDDDVRATGQGVPDPMQRSVHANKPKIRSTSDREGDEERIVVLLIAKATKKLVRRGGTRVGEGETERRRGRKSRQRREA
jgi:hypothetical protein